MFIFNTVRITQCDHALIILEKYDFLMKEMNKFAHFHFGQWALSVPGIIDKAMKNNLVMRKRDCPELIMNFDPEV